MRFDMDEWGKLQVMGLEYVVIQIYDAGKGWVGHTADCGHPIKYHDYDKVAEKLDEIRQSGKVARAIIVEERHYVRFRPVDIDRAFGVGV